MEDKTLTDLSIISVVAPVLIPAFFAVAFPPFGFVVGMGAGGILGLVFGLVARKGSGAVLARVGIVFSAVAFAALLGVLVYTMVPSGPGPNAPELESEIMGEVPGAAESSSPE